MSSGRLNLTALAFLALLASGLKAQTPIPPRPVDPDQAIPSSLAPATNDLVRPSTPGAKNSAVSASADANLPQLTVIADSSLKAVLQELAQVWSDAQPSAPDIPLTLTNAATLMAKVQQDPRWDVVISADDDDLKSLASRGLLIADTPRTLARNSLVIYGRKALVKEDDLDWFDLVGSEWKKVALPNPDLTQSGRVARHALQKHDLYDDDHKDIYIKKGTEGLALQVVEREQADAVFLYRTDLAGANVPGFEALPIDAEDAPPVFYAASTTRLARNPDAARSFINFIGSDAARAVWIKYGFETN